MDSSTKSTRSRRRRSSHHRSSPSRATPLKKKSRWGAVVGGFSLVLLIVIFVIVFKSAQKTAWEDSATDEEYVSTSHMAASPPPAILSSLPPKPANPTKALESTAPGKNLIVLIGDGMGFQHVAAARHRKRSLYMDQCPAIGQVSTLSLDQKITDSAASATAFSTGRKTVNGFVSQTPHGESLTTLGEHARRHGLRTGIVVTSSVTDATPAAFFTHTSNRKNEAEIAKQLASFGIDVMIGGGWGWFLPQEDATSLRNDPLNLINMMNTTFGREVFFRFDRAKKRSPTGNGFIALLSSDDLLLANHRSFTLGNLTQLALEELSPGSKNFFLLVEGSRIDWASHYNKFDETVAEILDFDTAVEKALFFAKQDGRTLVVITADHETGGLELTQNSLTGELEKSFSSKEHTGATVPLFAYGPGSENFKGLKSNAEVGQALISFIQSQKAPDS